MSIETKYQEILDKKNSAAIRSGRDPRDVTLMAVTKTRTIDEVKEVVRAGAVALGENKVQEIMDKYDSIPDASWHMIGHLQTNKVKFIVDKVDLIHSVDSIHLAKEIDKRAKAIGRVVPVLVQINSAMEATKTGIEPSKAREVVSEIISTCENIKVCGLMCIPPAAESPEDVRPYFAEARQIFEGLNELSTDREHLDATVLSMGMSSDFEVAIEEGSTMVRVGSSIFGPINYR